MSETKFTRKVSFLPAWDKRESNHGVRGVDIWFELHGTSGVATWRILTDWHLPQVQEWHKKLGMVYPALSFQNYKSHSCGGLLALHIPDDDAGAECEFLNGKKCRSEQWGYTESADLFHKMVEQGESAVWKALEEFYERYCGIHAEAHQLS